MTAEATQSDRATNRGLRIQMQTMEALGAAREKQFAACRQQRDDLLTALQGCIAYRNWQIAEGGVVPAELIDTWKRAEAAIAQVPGQ